MDELVVNQYQWIVEKQAEVLSKLADIEAMKAFNQDRENQGMSIGYTEDHFNSVSNDLMAIAKELSR